MKSFSVVALRRLHSIAPCAILHFFFNEDDRARSKNSCRRSHRASLGDILLSTHDHEIFDQ